MTLVRHLSISRHHREDEASKKAKQLNQKAVDEEEQRVTTTKGAQRLVNDRPWHRESSSAQPGSTSPDPAKGDKTKGRANAIFQP